MNEDNKSYFVEYYLNYAWRGGWIICGNYNDYPTAKTAMHSVANKLKVQARVIKICCECKDLNNDQD
jgi:hypothetical protein